MARPGSHGSGTRLDSSDLPWGEAWVLQRSAEADPGGREKGCWVGISSDASALLALAFLKSPEPLRSALTSRQPLQDCAALSISPSSFPFFALNLCPCKSSFLSGVPWHCLCHSPHPSTHMAWLQGCLHVSLSPTLGVGLHHCCSPWEGGKRGQLVIEHLLSCQSWTLKIPH